MLPHGANPHTFQLHGTESSDVKDSSRVDHYPVLSGGLDEEDERDEADTHQYHCMLQPILQITCRHLPTHQAGKDRLYHRHVEEDRGDLIERKTDEVETYTTHCL